MWGGRHPQPLLFVLFTIAFVCATRQVPGRILARRSGLLWLAQAEAPLAARLVFGRGSATWAVPRRLHLADLVGRTAQLAPLPAVVIGISAGCRRSD